MIVLDGSLRIDWLTEGLRPWTTTVGLARWRPSVRRGLTLHHAGGSGGPTVGRTGGLPELPTGVDWPVWFREDGTEGIPLHFVALIDCAALPAPAAELGYPGSVQDDVEDLLDDAVADDEDLAELLGTDAPERWLPLATFAYPRHHGLLYYLIQPRDLAARRFDRALFTWQST